MRDKNGLPQGIVVEVQNGDIERALRKLKKKMQNEGVLQDLKKKEFYVKPSEIRRRARGQALARMRKRNRIDEMVNKNDKTEN
jgi:small subunit ribosomal protein S21